MLCAANHPFQLKISMTCFQRILPSLTYEFISFVQPWKQFLAVVVIDWDAHEMALIDKIWLGAGVAGIQHIGDAILNHQILRRKS